MIQYMNKIIVQTDVKYKPLRKYSTNANQYWVFQTKKILLGLCLIGLGPESLVSRYIHAVTVKKIFKKKNTLLRVFCKRRIVLLSLFFSFSLFPWGTREGKGKRGESSALPSPLVTLGKGGRERIDLPRPMWAAMQSSVPDQLGPPFLPRIAVSTRVLPRTLLES